MNHSSRNLLTLVIVGLVLFVITNYYISKNKNHTYLMNIECSQLAPGFIRQISENTLFDSWNIELIQTKYNKSKNSCFGEFRFSDSLSSYGFKSIYDLTTNKEVATDSVFSLLDQKNTGKNGDEIVKEYEKIKGEIFLN